MSPPLAPLAAVWAGAALFMIGVMGAAWIIQHRTGQGGWTDAFWSLGLGAAGVGVALWPVGDAAPAARQWLVAVLIGLWGLRLGLHLTRRAISGEKDARYERLRQEWGQRHGSRMFLFLMLQALAGAFLALSLLLAARNPAPGLGAQDAVAVLVLLTGLIGAGVADRQLAAFKADPANRGEVCDRGLWAWSRHPNYFFEWLGWCAWPVFAISLDWPWGWLALTGPAYMLWLLTQVSGVPPLEQHMRRTRPDAFARYAARTSVFVPWPPKR